MAVNASRQRASEKQSMTNQTKTTKPRSVGTAERFPFEQRREMILKKAIDMFAERGFDATTRELATHLGTTQPLLYKYFKTKDELIQEVYRRVFLDVWDTAWDEILVDRTRPIQERLIDFYQSYTNVIMNRGWMRIYLFAGLKNVGITSSYIRLVEERVIRRIAMEICASHGVQITKDSEARYMEIAWSLQGSIFYYGVRKYAYELDPGVPRDTVINDVVRIFVGSWPDTSALPG
ncbi:TetR/AcrR family transcriptional regulator [Rhizobium laguerreae]|uniref:TetR/AcrR family transcriptional regulator n=1 Tax=Rhizobium laguerreae TaxID=1076926 RepID=A0AB35FFL7_9HYPH|nr:TetR/AcrR family transcriptional regulator [Rhizobium laguerreae]MBY3064778.1 TetR/AcrR family transcriptional regulator [Rhizobium laguerreae]